jgi:hypothetical protein
MSLLLQGYLQGEEKCSVPSRLGQIPGKAQGLNSGPSSVLCQAKSLPESHVTRAHLSEFDRVLEMSDFIVNLVVYKVCECSVSSNHISQ